MSDSVEFGWIETPAVPTDPIRSGSLQTGPSQSNLFQPDPFQSSLFQPHQSSAIHLLDQMDSIRAVILPPPPSVSPHSSIAAALELMKGLQECTITPTPDPALSPNEDTNYLHRTMGCVLVEEDGILQGILTERDSVRIACNNLDLNTSPVSSVMTTPVFTLRQDEITDLFVVYNLLRRHQIRHLPVTDADGHVVGIITLSSLRHNLNKSYFLRFRQVWEVMTAKVITVLPSDSLAAAAQRLLSYGISCVVVVQPQPHSLAARSVQLPVGILTERDILHLQALGVDFQATQVQTVMSSPLTTVQTSDGLAVVQEQMRQQKVRRLVVTSPEGELAGIVTETNLTKILDPLELYGIVEILQMQVCNLKASRDRLLADRNFDLEEAFQRQEFRLVYQPQFNLQHQRITGAEALIRWNSPHHGTIPPAEFIPWAEQTCFIVKLGYWILQTACQQAQTWRQLGLGDLTVSVNVSTQQLIDPYFVDRTVEILQETGLDPSRLKLELTESVLVNNLSLAAEQFQRLQAASIQIAIDDFGTGYASLSYLQYFSFDILKIDRTFVQDIDQNLKNQAIVASIVRLAHQLKFQVIAEGVETEAEQHFLRSQNCHAIQGYHFSPPLEAEVFTEFTQGHRSGAPEPS